MHCYFYSVSLLLQLKNDVFRSSIVKAGNQQTYLQE